MAANWNHINPAVIGVQRHDGLSPLHLLILSAAAVAVLIWAGILVFGWQPAQVLSYLLPLGFYGLGTTWFVWRRVEKGVYSVFSIPIFTSIINFIRFGLATLAVYADPSLLHPFFHGDYEPIRVTLLYFTSGMLAYWAGCSLVRAEGRKFVRQGLYHGELSNGIERRANLFLLWIVYLFVLSVRAYEVYMTGMNRSLAAFGARNENVAEIQFFGFVDSVGMWCFTVFTIERFSHPNERLLRVVFRVSFVVECFTGLVTGMKSALLMPFVVAAVVCALMLKKVNKRWLFAAFLLLVGIYPLSNIYRTLGWGERGFSPVQKWGAAAQYSREKSLSASEWLASGWDSTVQRLALLPDMALAMNLGHRAEWLKGDEHWWMMPFYPFVPRFIWPSKPILLKGERFSIATGSTASSSVAITIPGDLYLEFGFPGLLIGMCMLGMLGQWLTNMISGALRKESLFIYTAIFWSLIFFESDVFGFITGLMKSLVMLWVFVRLIYVPRDRVRRSLLV